MKKHKILIANRGEIAIRIAQACESLGIDFACVYTPEDEASGHVAMARNRRGGDAAVRISSYQDANEVLAVADHVKATAIHPGYGFFAEDFRFARRAAMRDNPLVFIGPEWRHIRDLGDKINTKRLARSLEVPTVPGSDRPIYDEFEAESLAESLFAFQAEQGVESGMVLVKASAGGGGMGIEEVENPDRFRQVYRRIRNYAKRQFNDEGVLIEQRLFDFNHLEVQVVSDRSGANPVHFGTRNCSVQSTGKQKRIETAPGFVPGCLRYAFDAGQVLEDIIRHSLAMASDVGYDNVGTWEWIVTPRGAPFLMEVNTRIQVENGVSGRVASIRGDGPVDLIREQIRMGLGEDMGYSQEDISLDGVSIEYRIIAEEPDNRFSPSSGTITRFEWPDEPWLTVSTQVPADTSYQIPTEFDPNLALAIVWGENLEQAKDRGRRFLESLVLEGVEPGGRPLHTNINFLLHKNERLLEF